MKIVCPQCQQQTEASPLFAGKSVTCPSCGQSVKVPALPSRPAPVRQTPSRKVPQRGAIYTRKQSRGPAPFLLAIGATLAVALGFAMFHYRESPAEIVQRLFKPSSPPQRPAPVKPLQVEEAAAPPAAPEVATTDMATLMRQAAEANRDHDQVVAQQSEERARNRMLEEQREKEAAAREGDEEAAALELADAARTVSSMPPIRADMPSGDTSVEPADLLTNPSSRLGGFIHPGLLHSEADFKRMRTHKGLEPWKSSWEKMVNGRHANLDWKPAPAATVNRGGTNENYAQFYRDVATAYVCAVCWRVTGKKAYAEKSIEILNAWSATLKELGGSYDKYLAAGIYGYEIANAAEIMRTYGGWKPEDFERFKKMMLTVFYPMNKHFVDTHGDSPGKIDHFWPNWELCNLASMVSIGVLCDDRKIYNETIRYMKRGDGPGAIKVAVYHIHPDGLGQWTEAARDQGHTLMGIGLMSAICEMAWKQGDDLYGYDNNRFLAACEYVAKYNLGEEVPFKKYVNSVQGTFTEPGGGARGAMRPVWELAYNHYVRRKGLAAPWTTKMAEKARPEGGVGDYGPNSGGYDQLGFGSFTATLDNNEAAKPARN